MADARGWRSVAIVLRGIGLAKGVFALHGVEVAGWRGMIARLMPCAIGMGLVTVESVAKVAWETYGESITWEDFLERRLLAQNGISSSNSITSLLALTDFRPLAASNLFNSAKGAGAVSTVETGADSWIF